MAVASENLASGMGTAAFLAFLMSLTNQRFSATQFALLSAFQSVGRVWIGPLAGVLAEAIGWPAFFLVAIAMGVPSLIWLRALWQPIDALDVRRRNPLESRADRNHLRSCSDLRALNSHPPARSRAPPPAADGRAPAPLLALPAARRWPSAKACRSGRARTFESLVPASQIEAEAARGYHDMLAQARAAHRLAPPEHVQLRRLAMISTRLRPFAGMWNERAIGWQWEVNLISSPQVNAFCMPGGKIAFFWGILTKLQADRRRGGDGDGPRDDPCAARARARADRQAGGHAGHASRCWPACSAGATRAARWPAWAGSCCRSSTAATTRPRPT